MIIFRWHNYAETGNIISGMRELAPISIGKDILINLLTDKDILVSQ